MRPRCAWAGDDPLYRRYHDGEWGAPLHDDRRLFEFLILEGFQAGLSWLTILRKREAFRRAFDRFDPERVARYDERKIADLLDDPGIVRNRLKVRAAIGNAQAFLAVQDEVGSFSAYLWGFVGGEPIVGHWPTAAEVPATSAVGDALSRDLKRRSFSFVGPTIVYAYLQATGLVMDHTIGCFRYAELASEGARPGRS